MSAAAEVRQFGAEIRRRRTSLGLTLDELAERAELSTVYLGEVERGSRGRGPSLEVALKIARSLGVALGDLLGGVMELSAGGVEAGRLYDALPDAFKQSTLQVLRWLVRHCAKGAAGL